MAQTKAQAAPQQPLSIQPTWDELANAVSRCTRTGAELRAAKEEAKAAKESHDEAVEALDELSSRLSRSRRDQEVAKVVFDAAHKPDEQQVSMSLVPIAEDGDWLQEIEDTSTAVSVAQ